MPLSFLSRDSRASRSALFDDYNGLEEGGLRASSSYSHESSERENDKAVDSLKERVVFLKKVSSQYCFALLFGCRLLIIYVDFLIDKPL